MTMFALHVLALSACMCLTLGVELEGNGYHIEVAINKHVPEDPQIINQLKEVLTSASKYLHQASRNYFYIRNVTILIPETWETEWKPSTLIFREADIRVDRPHPSMGNTPYTFQPGLCGEEGRYIHLTPDFVLDRERNRDFLYGDFGRLLVHEFAHLRYGVFDEYGSGGSSQHPVGYLGKDSKLEPTACSKNVTGRFLDIKTDRECIPNEDVGANLLSDDCAFIVNRDRNTATSSVMFAQYLEKVVDFCETNPTDPKLQHNAEAPNKHNKMCNYRGTWDVIREHPDVINSSPNQDQDTTPTFQVVQRQIQVVNDTQVCGRRFVFVLDLSGSMKSNERYFKLGQMADRIIRDILPVGTEVGIVVFSNNASVWSEMRYLTSGSDRRTLAEGLPTLSKFGGSTAIGKGLLKAIELLEKNGNTATEGRIFLITDGHENVVPFVKSLLGNITRKNIVVHTMAYSDAAANVLGKLSETTKGGQYSYFDGSSMNSTELEGAALRILKDISTCEAGDNNIEIHRKSTVMNSVSNSFETNVLIDSTVGNNTLFVFTLSLNATTQVKITDPNGNVYDDTSPNYNKDDTLNTIRFHFAEAQQGSWTYTLEKGTSITESVVVVVKSNPRSPGTLPFEVESWVGNTTVDLGSGQGLAVYSYVHQGYSPVIKAEVKAAISGVGVRTEGMLQDDGKLPDNTAGDGVYTSYFVRFSANQRYSLDITVNSVAGQTFIVREGHSLSSRAPVIYPNTTVSPVLEPVEPFTRTSSAGAVDVEGFVENVDQINPSRVTDLELIISDRRNRHVTLTWTAPGDDLNEGTVDRYDLRIAGSFEDLRQNFSDSYKLLESDITKGSDTPVPAGSQQSMTVSLPGHLDGDSYVFGLKAIDESNRSSDLSNLKAVTFARIVVPGSSPPPSIPETSPDPSVSTPPPSLPETTPDPSVSTPPPSLPETTPDPPKASLPIIIIVVSVCFVVLVLVAIIVSCLVCRLCKKHPKSDPNRI